MGKPKEVDVFTLEGIPGIGPITSQKLMDEGITDYMMMNVRSYIEIADITGMERHKAAEAVEFCKTQLQKSGLLDKSIMRGDEVLESYQKRGFIKFNCSNLDELLDGGLETEEITEISGRSTTGKTQMSHIAAVNVQLPVEHGGLTTDPKRPATCIYLDTEAKFSPKRIRDIVLENNYGKDEKDVQKFLNNIVVIKVLNAAHQILMLKQLSNLIKELNTKLIIIDSGTAFFRVDLLGMGNMGRRSQMLSEMSMLFKRICQTYKIAGLFVNQVYTSPEQWTGDVAVGGNIIAHTMSYRIMLKRMSRYWVATLYKSVKRDKEDTLYTIETGGLKNYKKTKKASANE